MTIEDKTGRKCKTGCYLFRVPTGRALDLRERVLFARLLPLPSPVGVQRLAREVGGLIDRQTVTDALVRLEHHGLVERTRVGRRDKWRAVRQIPSSAKHLFKWGGNGKFLYWTLVLPKMNPWKGKGSLERWVALAFHRHLARQGRTWKPAHMAKVLGVDARTLRVNLARLHAEGYLDGGTTVSLLGGRVKKPNRHTPTKAAGNTVVEEQIKQKAAYLGYTRTQLRKATVDAARTHAAMLYRGKYKGGSALKCLNARLDRELADRAAAGQEVRRAEQEQLVAGLRESGEQAARREAFQKQDERESQAVNRIRCTLPLEAKWKFPHRSELIERYGVEALERAADALESAAVSVKWNLGVEQIEAVIRQPSSAAELTPPTTNPPTTSVPRPSADEMDDMCEFENLLSPEPLADAPESDPAPQPVSSASAHSPTTARAEPLSNLMEDPEFAAELDQCLVACEPDDFQDFAPASTACLVAQ